MANEKISRRELMRDTAAAAAGITAGLAAANQASAAEAKPAKPAPAAKEPEKAKTKTRSYNENMEYRRLGRTGLWISAVSIGGHWKRIPHPHGSEGFKKNRADVISACMDHGINYVDACAGAEVIAYAEAVGKKRDKIHFGYSFYEHEMRNKAWQSTKKLLEGFDDLLKRAKLDCVDLWRITCYWQPKTNHTVGQEQEMIAAMDKARKAGKARFTGISTHKHDWVIRMMATYPEHIQVVVVPYTAGSKKAHSRVDPGGPTGWKPVKDEDAKYDKSLVSVIEAVKKHDCGWFGIKPFASGSVFKSRGQPDSATKTEDDERARLTLRYILTNEALTAPIPGLITVDQVKNAALAVSERRKFDLAEAKRYEQITREMWANLPENHQWLRDWQWV